MHCHSVLILSQVPTISIDHTKINNSTTKPQLKLTVISVKTIFTSNFGAVFFWNFNTDLGTYSNSIR